MTRSTIPWMNRRWTERSLKPVQEPDRYDLAVAFAFGKRRQLKARKGSPTQSYAEDVSILGSALSFLARDMGLTRAEILLWWDSHQNLDLLCLPLLRRASPRVSGHLVR